MFLCSVPIDVENDKEMLNIIQSCLGTKLMGNWYVLFYQVKACC